MPLTPEDVRNVFFNKPPVGKRGYDEEEVDAFLTEVEAELGRLLDSNRRLRDEVVHAGPDSRHELEDLAARLRRLQDERAEAERQAGRLRAELDDARTRRPGPEPDRAGEAVPAVLVMARRTAEDHLEDARRDAMELVAEARAKATQVWEESRENAMRDVDSAQRTHDSAVAKIEIDRVAFESAVANLADFAQHYYQLLREDLERRVPELGNVLMPELPRPFSLPG
ncbi:DivIVA domain-containing protein [Nucisporomicrobium flavum]|uniref:DivIVA domain-containing protein n=1 Tax=Nucisporomicrobium flavum TaxID=2785915 RepID=UPI0018F465C6|nr:DivIVA domain-containing protein [Nucisporomicrobium flavum]